MHSGIYPQTQHLQQNNRVLQLKTVHFVSVYMDFKPGAAIFTKKKEKKKKEKEKWHIVFLLLLAKSFISQIVYFTVTDLDCVEKHVENTD